MEVGGEGGHARVARVKVVEGTRRKRVECVNTVPDQMLEGICGVEATHKRSKATDFPSRALLPPRTLCDAFHLPLKDLQPLLPLSRVPALSNQSKQADPVHARPTQAGNDALGDVSLGGPERGDRLLLRVSKYLGAEVGGADEVLAGEEVRRRGRAEVGAPPEGRGLLRTGTSTAARDRRRAEAKNPVEHGVLVSHFRLFLVLEVPSLLVVVLVRVVRIIRLRVPVLYRLELFSVLGPIPSVAAPSPTDASDFFHPSLADPASLPLGAEDGAGGPLALGLRHVADLGGGEWGVEVDWGRDEEEGVGGEERVEDLGEVEGGGTWGRGRG